MSLEKTKHNTKKGVKELLIANKYATNTRKSKISLFFTGVFGVIGGIFGGPAGLVVGGVAGGVGTHKLVGLAEKKN